MRLHNLFESEELSEDIVEFEFGDDFVIEARVLEFLDDGIVVEMDDQALEMFEDQEELMEFIPLAIGAVGLGLSAYDAYKNYKEYKSGNLTGAELAKRVGRDAALTLATGGAAKLVAKGAQAAKAGFNALRGRGAAQAAAQADNAADAAKASVAPTVARSADDAADAAKASRRTKARGRLNRGIRGGGSDTDQGAYKNPMQKAIGQFSFECLDEAEYQGRKVKLNKPMQGDVKKSKVYVKNPKGNVVKVNFGHGGSSAKGKTMSIKKNNPARRKSFRARHNCSNPGPKHKARYWSCKAW
jgi:hypothetical protein